MARWAASDDASRFLRRGSGLGLGRPWGAAVLGLLFSRRRRLLDLGAIGPGRRTVFSGRPRVGDDRCLRPVRLRIVARLGVVRRGRVLRGLGRAGIRRCGLWLVWRCGVVTARVGNRGVQLGRLGLRRVARRRAGLGRPRRLRDPVTRRQSQRHHRCEHRSFPNMRRRPRTLRAEGAALAIANVPLATRTHRQSHTGIVPPPRASRYPASEHR